jgi:ankyrin repeat protein
MNKVNEYGQNPLLLALEAGQFELARLLIEAGADVNIKSKMYMTPLRVATQSGNLEAVKLLLAKGASPDAPEDEFPPLFYAISKGYDDIAQVLIEGGTDLNRSYLAGKHRLTAGDMAVLAKKTALVELIRQKGGKFTKE